MKAGRGLRGLCGAVCQTAADCYGGLLIRLRDAAASAPRWGVARNLRQADCQSAAG